MSKKLRIFELNGRVHLGRFDQVKQEELDELKTLGFNAVWLLGAWQITEGARKISKVIDPAFDGSPFAIAGYEFSPEMGGETAYLKFREAAHRAGLAVLLDFIPNHVALDSPWIKEDSDFFVRSDATARKQDPGDYFLHCSGELVAFGRDPYFPPWRDTAQLDYTYSSLRAKMTDTLKWISQRADGVRCDMAMLILRDYVRHQWYPNSMGSWFDERMPGEFWDQAIDAVRAISPDFTFMAECYWDKEPELQSLGFDLTYEKKLYDALVQRNASWVRERISQPLDVMDRSLYFIENHDEPRAASVFGPAENLSSLALILTLPGSALIHQGQMEGLRKKLAVQMPHLPADDFPDQTLKSKYENILKATNNEVFYDGSFSQFDTGDRDTFAFVRQNSNRAVAYIGLAGNHQPGLASTRLDVTALASQLGGKTAAKLTNILNSKSVEVWPDNGRYWLEPWKVLDHADNDSLFCLIEISPA